MNPLSDHGSSLTGSSERANVRGEPAAPPRGNNLRRYFKGADADLGGDAKRQVELLDSAQKRMVAALAACMIIACALSQWTLFTAKGQPKSLSPHYTRFMLRDGDQGSFHTVLTATTIASLTSSAAFGIRGVFPRNRLEHGLDQVLCRAGLVVTLAPAAYALLMAGGWLVPNYVLSSISYVAFSAAKLQLHVVGAGRHGSINWPRVYVCLSLLLATLPVLFAPGAWSGVLDGRTISATVAREGRFLLATASSAAGFTGLADSGRHSWTLHGLMGIFVSGAVAPAAGSSAGGGTPSQLYYSLPNPTFFHYGWQRCQVYSQRSVWLPPECQTSASSGATCSPFTYWKGTALWAWHQLGGYGHVLLLVTSKLWTLQQFKRRIPCLKFQAVTTAMQLLQLTIYGYNTLSFNGWLGPPFTAAASSNGTRSSSKLPPLLAPSVVVDLLINVVQCCVTPLIMLMLLDAATEHEQRILTQLADAERARAQMEEVAAKRRSFLRYVFHEAS